ncbi:uncharacterized protein si:ch211-244b2.4 isoform X2 [Toxotes jaculatrix]|uniref:uncharacterized protein si:ch211-244b2.4 isoform X2 n=1 Tax=Toxotes jaculatrix TaxID=941984 RepID=UPI001B3AF8AA|nr:uncharacterized protein si:ch211-244b2.4 isoform X2 [Toxotes jaculatrix]
MATASKSDSEASNAFTDSDVSDASSSDADSDSEPDCQSTAKEPCEYYNKGHCRDADRCPNLHICKNALKGNCPYGSKCKLNHPRGGRRSSREDRGAADRSMSSEHNFNCGQCYQWQLKDGDDWKSIDNDHIIEAQYCLPHTKGIKIYNTQYGAVSIDFNKMKVYGKQLRVRRLDDGNTLWIWYCTLRRKWVKYGDKGSKGNRIPVKNSDIEAKFQCDPSSSFSFNIGAKTLKIDFREMKQVSDRRKRRVTRRPLYRQKTGAGVSQAASALQSVSLGTKPQWQFEGSNRTWHNFKHTRGSTPECSVTSDDIEMQYQQNPQSSMVFKVKGEPYKLDFKAMNQTNLRTKRSRKVRRVLV